MELVLLTALGVGGATILGSVIGFLFKNITHKFSDLVLAFWDGESRGTRFVIDHCKKTGKPIKIFQIKKFLLIFSRK